MLFHVTLDHTPEDCPIVRTGASDVPEMLARADETGVKVISALGARPQYFGADRAHREGTPVNVNLYYFDLLNHHL